VVNRPGASSAVGARYVAQAKTCPNWRSCRTKGPTAWASARRASAGWTTSSSRCSRAWWSRWRPGPRSTWFTFPTNGAAQALTALKAGEVQGCALPYSTFELHVLSSV